MLEFNLNFFIIFSLISFFSTYLMVKYSKIFFSGSLLDQDFLKPQAFHKKPIARIGGIIILCLFSIFILLYFLIFGVFLKDYFIISLLTFLLGFMDDIKIRINPIIRLILMSNSLCIVMFFVYR